MSKTPPIDAFVSFSDDPERRRAFIGNDTYSPLRIALSTLANNQDIRKVVMVRPEEALPAWVESDSKVEIVDPVEFTPIATQEALQSLAAFLPPASTFGPALTSEHCATYHSDQVLKALEASSLARVSQVVVVPDTMGFLCPQALELVLYQAIRRGFNEAVYTVEGPRGLIPTVWAVPGLMECVEHEITIQRIFANISGVYGQAIGGCPSEIKRLRYAFTLANKRSRHFCQRVAEKLLSEGKSLADLTLDQIADAAKSLDQEYRAALPRDLEIEICAKRPLPAPYLPKPSAEDALMSVEDFRAVSEGISPDDELTLTLGGFGDPMLHPDLDAILAIARERFSGVAIKTFGLTLADYQRLQAAGVDIIQWRFGAWSTQWAEANGLNKDADFEVHAQALVDIREAIGEHEVTKPLIIPEVIKSFKGDATLLDFYAFCREAKYQPLVTSMANFGGAIESTQAVVPEPAERKPCLRLERQLTILADGSVLACTQMAGGEERIGNALETSISEIWQGQQMMSMLESHQAGEYEKAHPNCAGCTEWCRLT